MGSIEETGERLGRLLLGAGDELRDPTGSELEFSGTLLPVSLKRLEAPLEAWAVDGGQALVADAKSIQMYVTRAATAVFRDGHIAEERQGELRAHLLGSGQSRETLASIRAPVSSTQVDVNLLRDWGEWEAVSAAVGSAGPGSLVLIDGDLQPDWRISSSWLQALIEQAARRDVLLAGITKHSSLTIGASPLVGKLEVQARSELGHRATWWWKVASTRPDVGEGIQVLVARLDPDALFAFRVDLPAAADPTTALGRISALSDDAAFPGYPYLLSVADRLAACPGWLRHETWDRVVEALNVAGVPEEVRERAFADRHAFMERS